MRGSIGDDRDRESRSGKNACFEHVVPPTFARSVSPGGRQSMASTGLAPHGRFPSGNHYRADALGGIAVAAFGIVRGGSVHGWLCRQP